MGGRGAVAPLPLQSCKQAKHGKSRVNSRIDCVLRRDRLSADEDWHARGRVGVDGGRARERVRGGRALQPFGLRRPRPRPLARRWTEPDRRDLRQHRAGRARHHRRAGAAILDPARIQLAMRCAERSQRRGHRWWGVHRHDDRHPRSMWRLRADTRRATELKFVVDCSPIEANAIQSVDGGTQLLLDVGTVRFQTGDGGVECPEP